MLFWIRDVWGLMFCFDEIVNADIYDTAIADNPELWYDGSDFSGFIYVGY